MTLDLASDLYSIAEEAQYVKSKAETGKNNPAHKNVSQWHYFITNLVYRDENNQDIDCYINIDVKKQTMEIGFILLQLKKELPHRLYLLWLPMKHRQQFLQTVYPIQTKMSSFHLKIQLKKQKI
jgi:hypothetical protein